MIEPVQKDLIVKLKQSDQAAFKMVFDTFYESLFKHIYYKTRNYEIARDLTQETFVKCWEYRSKIDDTKSFYYWLLTIASNLTTNHFKREQMKNRHHDILKNEGHACTGSVDEQLEADQLQQRIDAIVNKYLPKKCQTIFIMSRFEGKSNDEIAAALSITKKTVENQLYEGLKTIRKKLKKSVGVKSYTIVLF